MERTWLPTCHVTVAPLWGLSFRSCHVGMAVCISFCCGYFELLLGSSSHTERQCLGEVRGTCFELTAQGHLPRNLGCENHSLKSTMLDGPRASSSSMLPPKYPKEEGDTSEPKDKNSECSRVHCNPSPPWVFIRYKFRYYNETLCHVIFFFLRPLD